MNPSGGRSLRATPLLIRASGPLDSPFTEITTDFDVSVRLNFLSLSLSRVLFFPLSLPFPFFFSFSLNREPRERHFVYRKEKERLKISSLTKRVLLQFHKIWWRDIAIRMSDVYILRPMCGSSSGRRRRRKYPRLTKSHNTPNDPFATGHTERIRIISAMLLTYIGNKSRYAARERTYKCQTPGGRVTLYRSFSQRRDDELMWRARTRDWLVSWDSRDSPTSEYCDD